ncbi:uncharacterized protein LOC104891665 isoform X2 [Beta vulgaris subsp. vulgaris]|uniref:uncharacterized protein LOC104891665 isoform X2 n=1 Tax=Beta vulgaris subsp. vulgaris TaxID=3555 RepID=UPI00203758B7|nr:uncharacterized protein LOC104891665 isoform X2 [Beta vulgaris subsp. vulgaris]
MEETLSDEEQPMQIPPSTMEEDINFDEDDEHAMEDEVIYPNFNPKPSYEAKIRELLRNINSIELKLCSHGSKEFMKLLRGDSGGELLHEYVRTSSKFVELIEAWNRRRGKTGMSYIMLLISVILGHNEGKYKADDFGRLGISRVLDKFAKSIIEEKLDDVYKELNCKEGKRQKAALLLVAAIVRRGSLLAAEVAKVFDFKIPVLPKLSEYRRKKVERRRKHSTRDAFIEFAMSFLEVGKPGLLRWVLQQREIFSGILRGLGSDDEETVVYVLSTLRDRVLTHESLVPPGLRSVLFGSVTLEQLVGISAWKDGELAAKLAYEVLHMVCIDPSNGLMSVLDRKPSPLKGNPKRLVDLMKKLKATEVGYHRSLLLAIVDGRPALASAYLDQFPYNLDDHTSSTWLSAVKLAANVVSSVRGGISWEFLDSKANLLAFEGSDVQSVLKCVCLRPFSRLIVNKGLLHSDTLIKHGTLRLLLEVLKLLSSFINALSFKGLSFLKQKVQDEVRILLPDPQVLFTLLSSVSSFDQTSGSALKRAADSESVQSHKATVKKKSKIAVINEDIDIVVGGLSSSAVSIEPGDIEEPREIETMSQFDDEIGLEDIREIWSSFENSFSLDLEKSAEVYFYCQVLEALKIYHGAFRAVLEVSYDFLKILPSNPLKLPGILVQSLLSMLIEHLNCSEESGFPLSMLPPIYKHLQSFLNLSLHSAFRLVREQAYILAKAAMISTGAFDHSSCEIGSWLLFLRGNVGEYDGDCREGQLFQSLSLPVVSFLCDVVSTVGNNLVKYWDIIQCLHSSVETTRDTDVCFSPLVPCALEKCLRLLSSESETFTLSEKSLISLYVSNTLKYILETQIDAGILAAVIHQLLSNRIENHISVVADVEDSSCEWRPIISLFLFSRSILYQETYNSRSTDRVSQKGNSSLTKTLAEVKRLLNAGSIDMLGISKALCSTIACTKPDDIVYNLPSVMAVSGKLAGLNCSVMDYFFLDQNLMRCVSKLWPDMFYSGLRMSVRACSQVTQDNDKDTSVKALHSNTEETEHTSIVFGSLLKEAPFYVLFPAIIFCVPESHSEIKELLVAKVSNLDIEQLVSSVRLVLFWFHQIQTSYRKKPTEQQELHSELCFFLVKHIVSLLPTLKFVSGSSANNAAFSLSQCLQEVAKTVFCHPAVAASLSSPFARDYEITEEFLRDSSEGLLHPCGEGMRKTELHVLKLLTATSDYLLALCSEKLLSSVYTECKENIVKAFRNLVQQIFLIFKSRFELWCTSGNMTLFPILCGLVSLMRFISPIELLGLANWMFSVVELPNSKIPQISNVSPLYMAFSIACGALSMLSQHMQSPNVTVVLTDLFWANEMRTLDATLFESIYLKAFKFATCFKIDLADTCLLKALTAANSLIHRQDCLPFSMEITRVIIKTPVRIVSHCLNRTDNTKAKILFRMMEISALHSSVFGQLFSGILGEDTIPTINSPEQICNQLLLDEECLMLLPAAALYISFSWTNLLEKPSRNIKFILTSYSRLLLDGFLNWNDFVSRTVFLVEYGNVLPCSVENLNDLFNSSLLRKAVQMLQWYFASSGDRKNKRLKLLCSLYPVSGASHDFMDFDVRKIDSYSVRQLTDLINRVVAKVSLCFVLLFPEGNKCSANEAPDIQGESFGGSNSEDSSLRFLDMLVGIWQLVVKKIPSANNNSDLKTPIFLLLRSLEMFTLRCIYKLILKTRSILTKMDSLPFIENMAKVSLLHRFGDPITLNNLRHVLSCLSGANLPVILLLQLLVGHSQLASTVGTVTDPFAFGSSGMVVKPISSFLRSSVVPTESNNLETSETYKSKLEVVKLLRLLFHLKATRCDMVSDDDLGLNLRDLSFLLLTTYGATVSEIDLEIYSLLSEIESAGGAGDNIIAEHDYLWGSSALRVGKGIAVKKDISDAEEDCRRNQFRDNLPINPKFVMQTVLYFPYGRTMCEKSLFMDDVHRDTVNITEEGHCTELGRIERYDPVFVLSLSIHSLTTGFLDPMEFAGLGLLAIALVSMGSPEDGIRKLAYEVVWRFKDALMRCQRKREVTRLKLLLTYLQNGIKEEWEKIPTILAAFVAEASVILLDPSHEHYPAISKFLMQSPWINLKSIPLFHDFFWSNSVTFRTDRMWMLRLLYAGINIEDDAVVYIRNSVLEILLSFYVSPLSDIDSKELILLVVKKCVKVQKMACYLVENCCLISWLSSVLALSMTHIDSKDTFFSKQLLVVLEVVHEAVALKGIMEWLHKHAIEQLSDLTCHLLNLLARCSKLVLETKSLVILILKVTVALMSQERNMPQPPLALSMRSLYHVYQAVDVQDGGKFGDCAEHGLKAILANAPPTTISDLDLEELSRFLMWAVSTAVQSDSRQALQRTQVLPLIQCTENEEHMQEESLISTLLRWLVASVVLCRVSYCNSVFNSSFVLREANEETLLSLIEHRESIGGDSKLLSGSGKILAATIFHLQQLVGMKCQLLPSVVAALSVLLLRDGSYAAEGDLSGHATCINLRNSVSSLWSKIYCPPEVNPSWRWSFYQPWADHATERTDLEKIDESHACQKLLVIISGVLRKNASDNELLSLQELESSGLFERERTNLQKG